MIEVRCPKLPHIDRRVIENLPGDIDEATIKRAFARSGSVRAADLFCPGFASPSSVKEEFRATRTPLLSECHVNDHCSAAPVAALAPVADLLHLVDRAPSLRNHVFVHLRLGTAHAGSTRELTFIPYAATW